MMNKRLMMIPLLVLPAIVLYAGSLPAQTTDPGSAAIYAGLDAEYLADPSGNLTINDITAGNFEGEFLPNKKKHFGFGLSNNANWIRFRPGNHQSIREPLLYFNYTSIGDIRVYVPVAGEKGPDYQLLKGGIANGPRRDDTGFVFPVFTLPDAMDPGRDMYIRVKSPFTANFQLVLTDRNAFDAAKLRIVLFLAFVFGIMVSMLLYNFVLFIVLRDRNNILYVLYTALMILYQSAITGAFKIIDTGLGDLLTDKVILLCFLAMTAQLIFTWSYLDVPRKAPVMRHAYRLFWGAIGAGIVLHLTGFQFHANRIAYLVGFLFPFLLITTVYICYRSGHWVSRFYMLAMAMLWTSAVVFVLRGMGVMEHSVVTSYSVLFSAAIESVLYSFALADRISIIKKEKEAAQDEMIGMQKSYSQSLERTVQERTRELEVERNRMMLQNEIMRQEIALARKIQEQLISKPDPTDYIYSLYKPMEQVGGDFYDFLSFDDSGRIGIFISDVSGHGVPAAFVTSMIKTTILQSGDRKEDPAALLNYINDMLQDRTAGNFITAFYGIYDPGAKSIVYSNAGHNQPYIIADSRISCLTSGKSLALAMFPGGASERNNRRYRNYEEQLPSRSKLLLFTDGLTEARPHDDRDSFFEYSNIQDIFIERQALPCRQFIHSLYERLVQFRGSESFDDDVCIICMDVA